MHPAFYISALLTFFCGMGLLGSILLTRTSRATSGRLLEVTQRETVIAARSSGRDSLKKAVLNGATWLRETMKLSHKADLVERFAAAGMVSSSSRDFYAAIRVVAPVIGAVAGSFFDSRRVFFMALFGGVGYLAPDIVLKKMIKARRKRIQLSIPDAIDLLVICVDAGLGMDQAMLRVSQELKASHRDLHVEFQTINREQRAGKARLEAWQSMAKRTCLAEIDAFVNMLMQTERFGTPIARALSGFADALRQKRRQRAEELAAKTTVKIMFPLVLFIFPTLFVVLLGPAVLNILQTMSGNN